MIEWLQENINEYTNRYNRAKARHDYDQMKIEWVQVETYQRVLDELQVRIHDGEISLTIDF
jgi:hypothetical protein